MVCVRDDWCSDVRLRWPQPKDEYKLYDSVRELRLRLPSTLPPFATLTWVLPLKPDRFSFLSTMLRMPAMPSGSNLAEGFVITSTRSIELAGNCCK